MEIRNEFELGLPVDEAFALLLDLDKVVPCLPGAELGERGPDGEREITVTVKLGPMRFVYDGTVRTVDHDPTARTATLVGKAREKRGGGTAAASIQMAVTGSSAGSAVRTMADVKLTGRAAQNGRGIVEDVSRTLIGQMAATLEERYGRSSAGDSGADDPSHSGTPGTRVDMQPTQSTPAEPIRGGRLLLSLLWSRIKVLWSRIKGSSLVS